MQTIPPFDPTSLTQEEKLGMLFSYLANSDSTSLIAYCIKHGLDIHDHAGVIWMLKNIINDDDSTITFIYGEKVLQLINAL